MQRLMPTAAKVSRHALSFQTMIRSMEYEDGEKHGRDIRHYRAGHAENSGTGGGQDGSGGGLLTVQSEAEGGARGGKDRTEEQRQLREMPRAHSA